MRMKILLVEDDPKLGSSLKRGLSADGYFVELCESADEAIIRVEHDKFDLMIVDWMLPGSLDGVELVKKLRDKGIDTPCLMLTARNAIRDRVEGLTSGSDDYLGKPFAYDELLARIQSLLRRPPGLKARQRHYGSLMIDDNNIVLKRFGSEIELSKKEWELLSYLIDHDGAVCSKAQIINSVWGGEAEVLDNTVEVYMGYLRAKLEKPFAGKPQLLKTIRGFGYKIVKD
jgi:DNA-binding response OmpR family regulator